MNTCDHKWIGNICTECGIAWEVYMPRELERLKAENARLAAALEALYEHDAEYITINHLGPINHNKVMRDAYDAIHTNTDYLSDLLAPTIELLEQLTYPAVSALNNEHVHRELNRLRSILTSSAKSDTNTP